jgi:hypothetical protein
LEKVLTVPFSLATGSDEADYENLEGMKKSTGTIPIEASPEQDFSKYSSVN